MSKAQAIQDKLWKAYGKAANLLGEEFDVYRSYELSKPIQDRNWIKHTNAAFSQDAKFTSAHDEGLSIWDCWIDGRLGNLHDIQQGDVLYNLSNEITYYVASAQSHAPIRAISAPHRVTISRSGYDNGGDGYAPGDTEVAIEVPCFIVQPTSATGDLGYVPASSYATDAVPNYEIYLWDPNQEIKIRDAIVDQLGNRSQVLSIAHSDIGTKLSTRAYEP